MGANACDRIFNKCVNVLENFVDKYTSVEKMSYIEVLRPKEHYVLNIIRNISTIFYTYFVNYCDQPQPEEE
jgi:hypothetical protein